MSENDEPPPQSWLEQHTREPTDDEYLEMRKFGRRAKNWGIVMAVSIVLQVFGGLDIEWLTMGLVAMFVLNGYKHDKIMRERDRQISQRWEDWTSGGSRPFVVLL